MPRSEARIGQREVFVDRKSSSWGGGHEPAWPEPKQTAGVERRP